MCFRFINEGHLHCPTAHSTVLTILPAFAMQQGVSQSDAAWLLSIIGLTNVLGRMLVGVVSDRPQVCCVWVVSAALVMGGITCLCISFSDGYMQFVIEAAAFGFCMGTYSFYM